MKAILVIDVPMESLAENVFASAVICEQREGYNIILKRMVKMSLKPMPKKKETDSTGTIDEYMLKGYDRGWNDCLKEIENESKECV